MVFFVMKLRIFIREMLGITFCYICVFVIVLSCGPGGVYLVREFDLIVLIVVRNVEISTNLLANLSR